MVGGIDKVSFLINFTRHVEVYPLKHGNKYARD